jgi:hypothetical protein
MNNLGMNDQNENGNLLSLKFQFELLYEMLFHT